MFVTAWCRTNSKRFETANIIIPFFENGSQSFSRFFLLHNIYEYILLKHNFDNFGH